MAGIPSWLKIYKQTYFLWYKVAVAEQITEQNLTNREREVVEIITPLLISRILDQKFFLYPSYNINFSKIEKTTILRGEILVCENTIQKFQK